MIDLLEERPIPLTKAAKLPMFADRDECGKTISVSAIYRWSLHGLRGVKLETVQIGGTRCTSVEALQRFAERLSRQSERMRPQVERRSPMARRRSHERAKRELSKMGIG